MGTTPDAEHLCRTAGGDDRHGRPARRRFYGRQWRQSAQRGGTAAGVDAQYFVLTFDEPMLTDNPVLDPDSVYNPANYQISTAPARCCPGVVTQVNYGLSEVAQMAETAGFSTNPNSSIPDNKWEVVLTLDDNGGALPNGTYDLEVRNAEPETSTSAGQTGLCNIYGTPLNLTGYQPDGIGFHGHDHDQQFGEPGRGSDLAGPHGDGHAHQHHARRPANRSRGRHGSASGNYVVVWTSIIGGQTNIVGQLYNASGTTLGSEFTVNTTASDFLGQSGRGHGSAAATSS